MAQRRVRFTAALNSYVHDQGSEGTCYAHAVATLVVDALRRLGVPAQSAPLRSTVLEELVARFGKEGAIVPTVLDWALRTYVRPHSDEAECEELETTDAVMEVLEQAEGKVVMDFRMSCSQWAHFEAFFRAEPMGILSAGALGDPHGRISGHAVVIEGSEDYSHGGANVPAHHFWRFKNSWGGQHADAGFYHVARDALPGVRFFAIDVPVRHRRFRELFLPGSRPDRTFDLRGALALSSDKVGEGSFGTIFRASPHPAPEPAVRERLLARAARDALPASMAVKAVPRADRAHALIEEMRHLTTLQHPCVVKVLGFTLDRSGRWALVMPLYELGSLSHPRPGALVTRSALPRILHCVATALQHVHDAGYIHGDVKESNVLLHMDRHAGPDKVLCGVLADFGSIQRIDAPRKLARVGTSVFRDPRVRSGDYGSEIDVYAFGCVLAGTAVRVVHTDASLQSQLGELAERCKASAWQQRPEAFGLMLELAQIVNQQPLRGGHVPTDVPSDLDEVDRAHVVYVSRAKYHHRSCPMIESWHRSSRTEFEKQTFEYVAPRVRFKPCSSCAHHFRFRFNVFPRPRGAVQAYPALNRPAPYPMDDIGTPPWYARILEPTGDDDHPETITLGPLHVDDAFEARAEALRYLCDLSGAYKCALRDPTPAGDAVCVKIRPFSVAMERGWPLQGDADRPDPHAERWSEDDDFSDGDGEYPELAESTSARWGKHKGTEEDVTRVMTENQIFWGASRVGRNGFDLLEDYKRHPDRVLNFLRSRGVSIRL
ncbi:hypothetical protein EMIHUDRAFT_200874 [Emiliania huxleyi CCMP1516]|uniref:Protein kinase domain-containing protein n=2 Tax=Emiliania huxleyi TaxID=2903 RepID=A0A0D3KLS6_EMIH1|nr:hypothetical protein EMIHUDRAFT_200874 [Emiliania huxleyi CCMP1516]EOD36711.1 hypothetical protein EMIHUDRAFT_200874 [Emiliania huxleyi CCMP1516]|eukprot:XP_005789140.1 hypothetical protein EMIHUDRAFT_200874 [Emiliania huxleyi CCMP1516]